MDESLPSVRCAIPERVDAAAVTHEHDRLAIDLAVHRCALVEVAIGHSLA